MFRGTGGQKLLLSGTRQMKNSVHVTGIYVLREGDKTPEATRLYHNPSDPNHPAKTQVLEGELLRYILEKFVPVEDLGTSAIPVHPVWAQHAQTILHEKSYVLVRGDIDLSAAVYNVFMSARHGVNCIRGERFQSQEEFVLLMVAGSHVSDLSIHYGGATVVSNVYIKSSAVEALGILSRREEYLLSHGQIHIIL